MDIYNLARNVRGINIENEIKSAIKSVKEEYSNLITEQTCMIYSGLLCEILKDKHVSVRVINTGDLDFGYEHMFLIANSGNLNYYLIDLTYSQFKDDSFKELLENGYQEIDNSNINDYLNIVTLKEKKSSFKIDDLYYGEVDKRR